jgi:hypothetical protein
MAKLITAAMTPVDHTRGNHSDLSLAEVPSQPVWSSRRQVRRTAISIGSQRCGVIGQDECLNQGVAQHLVPRGFPDSTASAQGGGVAPDRPPSEPTRADLRRPSTNLHRARRP